jgi:hypothetical protein
MARQGGTWHCMGVVPRYASFLELAGGVPVDWTARPAGGRPEPERLLDAALLDGAVGTMTVDMSVSLDPFDSRRIADNLVSSASGYCGCGTHTPNKDRPGQLGADVTRSFAERGYEVVGSDSVPGVGRGRVEVYPHPALLVLLGTDYRVKYQAGKARKFWPELTAAECRAEVVGVWA